ncbi:hypothetical protein CRE_08394 [Caenorhabditis remanei]|uniref:BTB domain-containing protein n=1 Tax=Caenorhabditis remanei TaxID=31234 RepID=E3MPI0_CAERE|nr:hypothetical protein CRE_08394 [Caenorhabditis remanei]
MSPYWFNMICLALKQEKLKPNFNIKRRNIPIAVISEFSALLLESTGLFDPTLRNFDETTKEVSDILVVNEEKFYVIKLATLNQWNGIDADDFQYFLELLYGEKVINEMTVEEILLIAKMYNTPVVIRQCEDFLLDSSKKTLKKKLQMSVKYNLEKQKKIK